MKKKASIIISIVLLIAVLTASLVCFTACDLPTEGYFVTETIKVPLAPLSTYIMGLPLGIVFDADTSYIEFTPDGICTVKLMLIDIASLMNNTVIKGLLEGDGSEDAETLDKTVTKEMLNTAFIDGYVNVMFPGFDITDLEGSLNLIKNSIGVELTGLDFENNDLIKAIDANLKNPNTDQVLPDNFTLADLAGLPQGIGLVIKGSYCLVDAPTADGTTFTMAMVGQHDSDTQPLMTLVYDDSDDSYFVTWTNYMLPLSVVFSGDNIAA